MTPTHSVRCLYEDLVRSHGGDVYRFAYRLCGERELAEDLAQETFCEAWRSIASLQDPNRGRAWLLQILRHRYAHTIRRQTRRVRARVSHEQLNEVAIRTGVDVLAQLSDQEILQQALDSLDDRFKEPFLLVFLEDFTCQAAADFLDLPLGTVLSRIHRARQQLRAAIRQLDPTADRGDGSIEVQDPGRERCQPASNRTEASR